MARLSCRLAVVLLFLAVAACRGAECCRERSQPNDQATFVDTDGDGLPDQRVPGR